MLAGSRFGNDSTFAHSFGQKNLSKGIVDFVSTGMVEFITLEINFCTAQVLTQTFCMIERTGSPNVVVSVVIKLFLEVWILLGKVVCVFKFKDEGHQCLRDETAAIDAEMPGFVWTRTI